jgi:hypothetical protein
MISTIRAPLLSATVNRAPVGRPRLMRVFETPAVFLPRLTILFILLAFDAFNDYKGYRFTEGATFG